MRLLQIPIWWTLALAAGLLIASIDGDMAAGITFACIFGMIFGGGMQAIKRSEPTPQRADVERRRRTTVKPVSSMPYGQMIRPRNRHRMTKRSGE